MRSVLTYGLAACLALTIGLTARAEKPAARSSGEGNIAHMVYFKLKDNSPAARQKLLAACKKYLGKHEGTVYFSCGALAEDFNRPVNDRDFDIALHLVFKDRAAHDKYQDHPQHKKFIEENKDNWEKVRVFDAVTR